MQAAASRHEGRVAPRVKSSWGRPVARAPFGVMACGEERAGPRVEFGEVPLREASSYGECWCDGCCEPGARGGPGREWSSAGAGPLVGRMVGGSAVRAATSVGEGQAGPPFLPSYMPASGCGCRWGRRNQSIGWVKGAQTGGVGRVSTSEGAGLCVRPEQSEASSWRARGRCFASPAFPAAKSPPWAEGRLV